MRSNNVKEWKIAVLGAGTMGRCIAQFFAMKGHLVNLYNRTPANLDRAYAQIKNNLNTLLEMEQIEEQDMDRTLSNIRGSSDLETSVKEVDMVIENLAEKEDVKKQIFAQLDQYCNSDVILSSDTSSMNIFEFLEVSHPERLIITHFFNPAHVMPLVEVVRGPLTSDEVTAKVKDFFESAGKTVAVLNKAIPGFILNRITLAVFREASYIAAQGWTTPEEIDKAVVSTFGPRYTFEGPFALSDFAGIDVYERLGTLLPPVLCSDTGCPEILKNMTSGGNLGVKSGKGFYEYGDELKARRDRDTRIIKMLQAIRNVNVQMDKIEKELS